MEIQKSDSNGGAVRKTTTAVIQITEVISTVNHRQYITENRHGSSSIDRKVSRRVSPVASPRPVVNDHSSPPSIISTPRSL